MRQVIITLIASYLLLGQNIAYAQTQPYHIDCDTNGCVAPASNTALFFENNVTSGNSYTEDILLCNNSAAPIDLSMQLAELTETVPAFTQQFTVTLPDNTTTSLNTLTANHKLATTQANTCDTLPLSIRVGQLDNTFQQASLSFNVVWTIEQEGQVLASVDTNASNALTQLPLTGITPTNHALIVLAILLASLLLRKLSQHLLDHSEHTH